MHHLSFNAHAQRVQDQIREALGLAPSNPAPAAFQYGGLVSGGNDPSLPMSPVAAAAELANKYKQDQPTQSPANASLASVGPVNYLNMAPQSVPIKSFAVGGGAWTRKEGKNPEGGLNEKGRASLRAQGHDIKRPVSAKLAAKSPEAAARRKSFCARMSGMPGPMKDEKGRPTRKALSLRKWDCR